MNPKDKAIEQYRIAQHLLETIFPLVKDPKLLMGIIQNIDSSLNHATEAILSQQKVVPKSINAKINLLKKFNINKDLLSLIPALKKIIKMHKKSPIEFKRGQKHIICNDNYELEVLSVQGIERYLEQNRNFLTKMEEITERNK